MKDRLNKLGICVLSASLILGTVAFPSTSFATSLEKSDGIWYEQTFEGLTTGSSAQAGGTAIEQQDGSTFIVTEDPNNPSNKVGVTGGTNCAVKFTPKNLNSGTALTGIVVIEYDARLTLVDSTVAYQLPFVFGTGAASTGRINIVAVRSNGQVILDGPSGSNVATGKTVVANEWHSYKMVIDTNTGVQQTKLYLDGELVATNGFIHGTAVDVDNMYFITSTVSGGARQPIYFDNIRIYTEDVPQVYAQTRSKALADGEKVILTKSDDDATIYYTIDGTAPTTESSVYSDGIEISGKNITVKAVAVKSDTPGYTYTFGPYSSLNYTENFDQPDSTALNTLAGWTVANMSSAVITDGHAVLTSTEDTAKASLNFVDYEFSDVFTTEMSVTLSGAEKKEFAIENTSGGQIAVLTAENGEFTANGQVLTSYEDASEHKICLTVDTAHNTYTIAVDNDFYKVDGTFSTLTPEVLALNLSNGATVSLDYVKIYLGAPTLPSDKTTAYFFEQTFNGYADETDISTGQSVVSRDNNNTQITAIEDPLNPKNMIASVKKSDTSGSAATFKVAPPTPLSGKIVLEYDAYFEDVTDGNFQFPTMVGRKADDTGDITAHNIYVLGGTLRVDNAGSLTPNPPITINSKEWHTFKFIMDTADVESELYFDGALVTKSLKMNPISSIKTMFFKLATGSGTGSFSIDNFRIYSADGTPQVAASPRSSIIDYGNKITLSTDVNTRIKYTTDGTEPTITSPDYVDGIALDADNLVIKAVAMNSSGIGHTYTFGPYNLKTVDGMAFTDVKFLKGSTTLGDMDGLVSGDTVKVEFSFFNTNTTPYNADIIVGLYGNNGTVLKKLNFGTLEFAVGADTKDLSLDLEQENLTDCVIRAFIWNGIDELMPLTLPKTLD